MSDAPLGKTSAQPIARPADDISPSPKRKSGESAGDPMQRRAPEQPRRPIGFHKPKR